MNFCSLDEAYGSDPFIETQKQIHNDETEECLGYDMNDIHSYAQRDSSTTIIDDLNECSREKPKKYPQNMCKPIYIHTPVSSSLRNKEVVNAIIYIVSGIYVIFVLDVFVRMGSNL